MADSDETQKQKQEKVLSELEVIGRCKQCGKPLTVVNEVTGPTGHFCGGECKERHEAFTKKAHALDMQPRSRGAGLVRSLRKLVSRLIVLAVILAVLGFAGTYWEIPVLSKLVLLVRTLIEL